MQQLTYDVKIRHRLKNNKTGGIVALFHMGQMSTLNLRDTVHAMYRRLLCLSVSSRSPHLSEARMNYALGGRSGS